MENHGLVSSGLGGLALLLAAMAFPYEALDVAGAGALVGFGAVVLAVVALNRSPKSIWPGTLGVATGGVAFCLNSLCIFLCWIRSV